MLILIVALLPTTAHLPAVHDQVPRRRARDGEPHDMNLLTVLGATARVLATVITIVDARLRARRGHRPTSGE